MTTVEFEVGDLVQYVPASNPEQTPEYGVVTGFSFTLSHVFVRYFGDINSKATRTEDLRKG